MAQSRKSLFQNFIDWVRELIGKLRGAAQNRSVTEDLQYLEKRLAQVYQSAENKNAATDAEEAHSISTQGVIDLSNDNGLTERIVDAKGSAKYNIIRDYIFETLGNQTITLSDGRNAIVDRSDAAHIASRAGDKKPPKLHILKN